MLKVMGVFYIYFSVRSVKFRELLDGRVNELVVEENKAVLDAIVEYIYCGEVRALKEKGTACLKQLLRSSNKVINIESF